MNLGNKQMECPIDFDNSKINIGFWGKYIPLQGVEYIIRALPKVQEKNCEFYLLGSGQTYSKSVDLAKKLNIINLHFIPKVEYSLLPEVLGRFDIALGIFGDTKKTQRVIPNKIFEAGAVGLPVLTADTPAIRELFKDGYDICLCNHADEFDLAEKIDLLCSRSDFRKKLGENIKSTINKNAIPKVIVYNLLRSLSFET